MKHLNPEDAQEAIAEFVAIKFGCAYDDAGHDEVAHLIQNTTIHYRQKGEETEYQCRNGKTASKWYPVLSDEEIRIKALEIQEMIAKILKDGK